VRGATVNVIGTLNVFEAARACGLRAVVYASSAAVYGPRHGRHPEPVTHYGAFKLANEGCARSYWREHGVASLGLRPFVVYGPGRDTGASAGVSLACRAAAQRRPYTIPFTGSAGMVYVEDVADLIHGALAAGLQGAELCNLVGEVHAVPDVIAEIRRHCPQAELDAAGTPLPLSVDVAADEPAHWSPGLRTTPLREGIARTIAFYR
jgi:UDP-glucose 4-epimerase